MTQTLIVATGNPGKVAEMQAYLTDLPWKLRPKPPEIDIEETGITFMENAQLKAAQVAIALNAWAIADDSGLAVNALNGAPGLYSARYGPTDSERIARLLQELGDEPNRQAEFVCAIAIANSKGQIKIQSEGRCAGEILKSPRGSGGFGYDPIFYVPSAGQSFAEMSPADKHRLSHRGLAFAQLLPQLSQLTELSSS
ncbi:MAG: RdgB/HAM1 family non-canonical purine NTP pyrophosphatase [Cyanobacteria bacterium P01_H01_bin.15]